MSSESRDGPFRIQSYEPWRFGLGPWMLIEVRWFLARWWFQRFFIFIPTWGRFPIWLIFFKGVETTNKLGYGRVFLELVGIILYIDIQFNSVGDFTLNGGKKVKNNKLSNWELSQKSDFSLVLQSYLLLWMGRMWGSSHTSKLKVFGRVWE